MSVNKVFFLKKCFSKIGPVRPGEKKYADRVAFGDFRNAGGSIPFLHPHRISHSEHAHDIETNEPSTAIYRLKSIPLFTDLCQCPSSNLNIQATGGIQQSLYNCDEVNFPQLQQTHHLYVELFSRRRKMLGKTFYEAGFVGNQLNLRVKYAHFGWLSVYKYIIMLSKMICLAAL